MAAKKFFTYKPGTGGSQLVLKPGQTLGYQAGKGYYAKPPGTVGAAPGGGGGGGGGGVVTHPPPNYGADLVGSPDFTEANADYEYNVRTAHQNRANRVRAALIKLGFQPGSASAQALAGIEPGTAELAANNSMSALAQLGLQRGQQRADLSAELAARGLLDSGALRGGENMVQSAYDQGLVRATQDYLDEQNTALGDEATTLATGQSTFTAAKAAAAAAAARNPLFTPAGDVAAPGNTLAPGQAPRPAQTPVLAKPPAAARLPLPPGTRFFVSKAQAQRAARPGQQVAFRNGRYYLR